MIELKISAKTILWATSVAVLGTVCAPQVMAKDGKAYIATGTGFQDRTNTKFKVDGVKDAHEVNWHTGDYDVELVGGYDFGTFRLEGEASYKRSRVHYYTVNVPTVLDATKPPAEGFFPHITGRIRQKSLMINALAETGGNEHIGVYAGGGIGLTEVNVRRFLYGRNLFLKDKDVRPAFQAVAGVRLPIGDHLEAGLKGRYMMTSGARFTGAINGLSYKGDFDTVSALGTVSWNF